MRGSLAAITLTSRKGWRSLRMSRSQIAWLTEKVGSLSKLQFCECLFRENKQEAYYNRLVGQRLSPPPEAAPSIVI